MTSVRLQGCDYQNRGGPGEKINIHLADLRKRPRFHVEVFRTDLLHPLNLENRAVQNRDGPRPNATDGVLIVPLHKSPRIFTRLVYSHRKSPSIRPSEFGDGCFHP